MHGYWLADVATLLHQDRLREAERQRLVRAVRRPLRIRVATTLVALGSRLERAGSRPVRAPATGRGR